MGSCCGKNKVHFAEDAEPDKSQALEQGPGDKYKGPTEKRSCTDIIFFIAFVVCFLGMIIIGGWAYSHGDPTRLLYPIDSEGNMCGVGTFLNKPFLFFFDLIDCAKVGPAGLVATGCPTTQVCVDKCPDSTFYWLQAPEKMICRYGVDPEAILADGNVASQTLLLKQYVENDTCAAYYVASNSTMGRCLPAFISELIDNAGDVLNSDNGTVLLDKLGKEINQTEFDEGQKAIAVLLNLADYGTKVLSDIRATWWMILVALGFAMAYSFVWIVLMRWLAAPMVWFSLLVFPVLFLFGTYYCFINYQELKDEPTAQGGFKYTSELSYWSNLKDTWFVLGLISVGILIFFVVMLIFVFKRVLVAIAIIGEASKALQYLFFILLYPVVPFFLLLCLFTYWGATAVFLASVSKGYFYKSNESESIRPNATLGIRDKIYNLTNHIECDPNENSTKGSVCNFVKFGGDEYTIFLQFYMLFMLFWTANVIVALSQMTVAGAFASYFWAFRKPEDIPKSPVLGAFWRCLRYHMGTIAFGALLIAIVQIIRVILEYVDHKLKGRQNKFARCLIKCLKCCFWCLEKLIKIFNTNAYIMTAIYGHNFCMAGWKALSLLVNNFVRMVVLNYAADFIILIGKLVVVGTVVILSYVYFSGTWDNLIKDIPILREMALTQLNFYHIPILIIGFGSFVIASCFFSVYNMGVDTIMLCFLLDLDQNDGSEEKPYYMSKDLLLILNKENRTDDQLFEQQKAAEKAEELKKKRPKTEAEWKQVIEQYKQNKHPD